MEIKEFLENYNFHDCKISNIQYNAKDLILSCNIKSSGYFDKNLQSDKDVNIFFHKAINLKCVKNISTIDDYILNIWKTKGSKDGIEIVLDNEDYTTIYFNAKDIEIKI